jgi:NitT/TauT family transport system substrate-binding protein
MLLRRAAKRLLAITTSILLIADAALAAEPFRLVITEAVTPLLPNSVMELALAGGYFRREGVEVKLIRVEQTPLAVAALIAGEGDMANISVDALLHLAARGQRQWKAVISPNKSFPFLIAARREIATVADLPARVFGVGRIGSLDHSLTSAVLRAKGVEPSVVNFVSIGQPQLRAQALAIGRTDAATVSLGTWLGVASRPDLHVLLSPQEFFAAAPVISKVNVVSDKTMAAKSDQISAVVSALIKAARDFATRPDEWVAAMQKLRPDVKREDLEALATQFAPSWSVNGGMNAPELQYTADWLYRSPEFKNAPKIQPSDWIDFSVLDAVLAKIGIDRTADPPTR